MLQSARNQSRKRDTREKIQLGGLVVKAGLRNADRALIMGLLAEASERMSDPAERERWIAIGKEIFANDLQADDLHNRPGDPHDFDRSWDARD